MRIKSAVATGLIALASLTSSCASTKKDSSVPRDLKLSPASKNYSPDKYAFLICGVNEERFTYDLSAIYQVLLRRGFKDKNIITLDEHGTEDFIYHSNGIASKENVMRVFDHLESVVDPFDTLVVHIDDHGTCKEIPTRFAVYPQTLIGLADGGLSNFELYEGLKKIKPKIGIVTVDTCHAEGMLKWCKPPYIGIAGTKEDSKGFSGIRDSFGGYFYISWCDGETKTIREAFDNAKKRHSFSINGKVEPQIITENGLENMLLP